MVQRYIFKQPITIGELVGYQKEIEQFVLNHSYNSNEFNLSIEVDWDDTESDSSPIKWLNVKDNDSLMIEVMNKIANDFHTYYVIETNETATE